MKLGYCSCLDPDPLPIQDGSRTTVCQACSGWYTVSLSDVGLAKFHECFANEPMPPRPVEPE